MDSGATKKLFQLICLTIFSGLLLSSCASNQKYAVRSPFLYKIQRGETVGYLFGTVHVGVVDSDLPDDFWKFYEKADSYAFETDAEIAGEFVEYLKKYIVPQKGSEKNSKLLGPIYTQKVKDFFKSQSEEVAQLELDGLSPFGLNTVISNLSSQDQKIEVPHGEAVRLQAKFMLDRQLLKTAKKSKRPIYFLDRYNSEKIAQCFAGNDAEQIESVKQWIDGKRTISDVYSELKNMVEVYKSGDAKKLQQAISDMDNKSEKCLLSDRNETWAREIERIYMTNNAPFISVGAAHLINQNKNLIHLLKEEGFQIERMTLPVR